MNKPISEKITELRKARSLTQEKLGELLGVSSQAVSKWEKGDSMPDIMLLPQLCEIFGITADALLEVPSCIKNDKYMSALSEYAKEAGECKAAFEAVQACSSDSKGSAQISKSGIKVINENGYALVLSGEEILRKIQNTDFSSIQQIFRLITDENIIKVIRTLDFVTFRNEDEIAALSGLTSGEVQTALFKLLKMNICECNINDEYTFGIMSFTLFAVLSGIYIASPEGGGIYSVNRSYPPKENK